MAALLTMINISIQVILLHLPFRENKQAEKIKSNKMKLKDEGRMNEGRMKDEQRMMNYEGWMMKDDDFKLLRGFEDGQTD